MEVREQKVEVEGERRHEVDDVDRSAEKAQSAGTDNEPNEQFEREPAVADALDVEEGIVRDRSTLAEQPGRRGTHSHVAAAVAGASDFNAGRQRDVLDRRHSHVGVSFEAEGQDRDDYEEHGQSRDDLKYTQTASYLRSVSDTDVLKKQLKTPFKLGF